MKLSGKDLAEKIGCARSTLSEATKNGYLVGDRWDVQDWAVCSPSGRVKHYVVPDEVAFLNAKKRENPLANANSGNSTASTGDAAPSADASTSDLGLLQIVQDQAETTRTVAEEAGDTTQLVSDETDVEGTARNAGMAYAAGKAIEHDTPGARAFWTIGSALAGGIGGHAVSDGSPWAALLGAVALGSAGYLVYGQQPRRQEGFAPRRDQRSGQQGEQNGDLAGRRGETVRLLDVPPSMNPDLI
jgi:hypothetical protein